MTLTIEEKRRIVEEEKLRNEIKGKSVLISVILSCLIPGLGDLYCGSWIKALIFFVLDLFSLILLLVTGIGAFLCGLVWVCGLISAWLSANNSQKRRIRKLDKAVTRKP
jgi:TM2 domain-containing membrane protein YozV